MANSDDDGMLWRSVPDTLAEKATLARQIAQKQLAVPKGLTVAQRHQALVEKILSLGIAEAVLQDLEKAAARSAPADVPNRARTGTGWKTTAVLPAAAETFDMPTIGRTSSTADTAPASRTASADTEGKKSTSAQPAAAPQSDIASVEAPEQVPGRGRTGTGWKTAAVLPAAAETFDMPTIGRSSSDAAAASAPVKYDKEVRDLCSF
jgi:hypothetical protein